MKVLGMPWDIYGDQISIPVKDCPAAGIYTKRQILKQTTEVLDPLDYSSPELIIIKLLLRDIWQNDLD